MVQWYYNLDGLDIDWDFKGTRNLQFTSIEERIGCLYQCNRRYYNPAYALLLLMILHLYMLLMG
jgi:GH18 family chitinase